MEIKKFGQFNEEDLNETFGTIKGISNSAGFLEELHNKFKEGENEFNITIKEMKKTKSVKHTERSFMGGSIDSYHDIYIMSYEIRPPEE